ncbi:type IV pilus biogenesis/stability protein PilW [Vibrio quintilis]|uniref:Tetratricopeptide repeat protein n=1 Tax=Vibrio quintilis TaxID=1117707 RepID=A0A1M7YU52_9VIBR|nr:type IV pilus biogenesis/stability protein PilW [Vibrio quintilis]SHO56159.1 Tetratricopeptide repeat protein [Vibrio quintilis]
MNKSVVVCLSLCACTLAPHLTQEEVSAADTRISLGIAYLQKNQREKARINLLKAQKVAPLYIRTLMALAYYDDAIGEESQASRQYHQALALYPEQPDLLNNYGTFLCKHNHYQSALRYFRLAYLQTDYINIADSFENAGLCALKSGQKTLARQLFTKAIDYQPGKTLSLFHLVNIESEQKEFTVAEEQIRHYINQFGPTAELAGLQAKIRRTKQQND